MKSTIRTILCVGAVMTMTACEHVYHYGNKDSSNLVHTQHDTVSGMTPPPMPGAEGNLYAADAHADRLRDPNYRSVVDPAFVPPASAVMTDSMFTGGIITNDTSVTIFPLEGEVVHSLAPVPYNENPTGVPAYYAGSAETQIFFKHGSSRLGSGDKSKLRGAAETAKFAPVNRVTVAGYASPPTQAGSRTVEGHIINLKQSMNRAFAVSRNLMNNGVPAEKIKTVSWGSTKPTGSDSQDRRVDVVMGEQ